MSSPKKAVATYRGARGLGPAAWLALLALLLLLAGCLHLQDPQGRLLVRRQPGPLLQTARPQGGHGLAWLLALGMVSGLGWWAWRRRGPGQTLGPMEREELALLRTARDALSLLLRRRSRRLRVLPAGRARGIGP